MADSDSSAVLLSVKSQKEAGRDISGPPGQSLLYQVPDALAKLPTAHQQPAGAGAGAGAGALEREKEEMEEQVGLRSQREGGRSLSSSPGTSGDKGQKEEEKQKGKKGHGLKQWGSIDHHLALPPSSLEGRQARPWPRRRGAHQELRVVQV